MSLSFPLLLELWQKILKKSKEIRLFWWARKIQKITWPYSKIVSSTFTLSLSTLPWLLSWSNWFALKKECTSKYSRPICPISLWTTFKRILMPTCWNMAIFAQLSEWIGWLTLSCLEQKWKKKIIGFCTSRSLKMRSMGIHTIFLNKKTVKKSLMLHKIKVFQHCHKTLMSLAPFQDYWAIALTSQNQWTKVKLWRRKCSSNPMSWKGYIFIFLKNLGKIKS